MKIVLIDLDYQKSKERPWVVQIIQLEDIMGIIAFEAALFTWAIFGTTKAGLEPIVNGNPYGWIGIVTGVICFFAGAYLHHKRMGRK